MNRHIKDSLRWKFLAGLISESEYNEGISQVGQPSVPSTPQQTTPNQPQTTVPNEEKETAAAEVGLKKALDAVLQNLPDILSKTQQMAAPAQPVQEIEDFLSEDLETDMDYVDLDLDNNFDYKYHSFNDFLNSNFGQNPSTEAKVKAIEQWAAGYNMGENPGDFKGVSDIMTPEVLGALKGSEVSKIFIDELEQEINGSGESFTLAEGSQDLNEVVATLAGAALTVPALMQMVGKAGKWTGKKLNNDFLQKAGENLTHAGHKVHHAYIGVIEKALHKVFPKASEQTIKTAANSIFLAVVAGFAVDAGIHAIHAAANGHIAGAGIEGILASVKTGEIVHGLPEILSGLGLLAAKA